MESESIPRQFRKTTNRSIKPSVLFPEGIIEEILSRLAVKSLLRFRCVSKSWRSLIGSKRFIKTHLQKSSENTDLSHHRLILKYHHGPRQHSRNSFDDMLSFPSESVRIVGCCNGLVCILKQGCFSLWNPTTKICRGLPKIENLDMPWYIINYGFGWDESSGAHKVFVVLLSRNKYVSEVYSSKTNSWKTVETLYCPFSDGKGQFVSGKLHWYRKTHAADIVTFDLKSEEFGMMELPCRCDSMVCLGVIEGCLCVVCDNERTHFDVWVMKQKSWVKVMAVPVHEPYRSLPLVAPACIRLNVEVSLVRGSTFLLYDPQEDMLSQLKRIRRSLAADLYVESLVSPVPDMNV